MTRDDLLTLLRAWGWSQRGQANRGALDIWEKGRATIHLPNLAGAADYDECLQQAEWGLATTEGPRLLAVVREVAALHQRTPGVDSHGKPYATCSTCLNGYAEPRDWPCPTGAALERMGGA